MLTLLIAQSNWSASSFTVSAVAIIVVSSAKEYHKVFDKVWCKVCIVQVQECFLEVLLPLYLLYYTNSEYSFFIINTSSYQGGC